MKAEHIIARLKARANPANAAGMARYGINPRGVLLGVSMPELRALAKEIGINHGLALALWDSEIHEAKILASLIDDYREVPLKQMEGWVSDFNSWDVCDQVCSNLFQKTPFAVQKALEWSKREEVFVKRAGFVLMARIAVADKLVQDELFEQFYPLIMSESGDDRPMVRKAVNWALRQIGKRNLKLNRRAIEISQKIRLSGTRAGRWIAADALRELVSSGVQERLAKKSKRLSRINHDLIKQLLITPDI
jgi:3-methyladenine DNA glycosylase AlkD